MQSALTAQQRLASDDQDARTQGKREEPLHWLGRTRGLHHATFTLALRPLIWDRLSFATMPCALSDATLIKTCLSRTSTLPIVSRGTPVAPRMASMTSLSEMPISAPTFMNRRVWPSCARPTLLCI